ncbi:MAG: GTPase domain-containing protein [Planctomycetaceae bacterium]
MSGETQGGVPAGGPFAESSAVVTRLATVLAQLEPLCQVLQIPPLPGREWYETLTRKLVPQLGGEPFIVAAVVGGTNIGKSVVFNHLAGTRASATSPLASGTRHPTCLVPAEFAGRHRLAEIFPGFVLREWAEADGPLGESDEHWLFWKSSAELPANLLVLDTPDIDSDAPVNWLRADRVRHCADVLVAVLTQQKYNDAAVKQFFRKAAAEDKAVVVVFNQCLLPEDEEYWPRWLETFSRETGIVPDLLYVAPNDRRAAEANRLPFYEKSWPLPQGPGERDAAPETAGTPRNLRDDLAGMRFAEIKLRTVRGALAQVAHSEEGLPGWLAEVRGRAAGFEAAASLLSMQQLARIDNWPNAPTALLVGEVKEWWRTHREGMVRTIHDAYSALGGYVLTPVKWVAGRFGGPPPDPVAGYVQQERDLMLRTIDLLYTELTRLAQLGNELLRPRLEQLLAGQSRAQVLRKLTDELATFDFPAELHDVVDTQLQKFRADSPQTFKLLRNLDSAAAMARPVTSVVLFAAAAGPAGHALAPFVSVAAAKTLMVHILGDVAGGTGAMVVGETAISGTLTGLRLLEARFRQLQTAFAARRVEWFAGFLRRNLLGQLHDELDAAVGVVTSPAYAEAQRLATELTRVVASAGGPLAAAQPPG